MIRPISVATNGFISNSLKSLSIASDGMLLSTAITVPEIATPKFIYSTDHNLDKIKRVQKIIKQDESEILEIISFIAKRIL
jgi:hypothetical protein